MLEYHLINKANTDTRQQDRWLLLTDLLYVFLSVRVFFLVLWCEEHQMWLAALTLAPVSHQLLLCV